MAAYERNRWAQVERDGGIWKTVENGVDIFITQEDRHLFSVSYQYNSLSHVLTDENGETEMFGGFGFAANQAIDWVWTDEAEEILGADR